MTFGGLIVTGSTGYLGSHFVLRMLQSGHAQVTSVVRARSIGEGRSRVDAALQQARDSLGEPRAQTGGVQVVPGDVSIERCGLSDAAVSALRASGVDECWHFAADLRYEAAHRTQIWRTNVEGTRHALNLAHASGARRFVYVSTAYTAGIAAGTIAEDYHDGSGPFNNAYEESKCAAELLLRAECRARGLLLTILRPSIVIGPRTTKRADGTTSGLYGLLRAVVALQPLAARAGVPIRVPATVGAEVNLIPIDTVLSDMIALRAAGFGSHEVYHLTAPTGISVVECFNAIAAVTGLRNIALRPPGSFVPSALERRIARRVEFYLGYLTVAKTFAHRLPGRWRIDGDEFRQYVAAAYPTLVDCTPLEASVALALDQRA